MSLEPPAPVSSENLSQPSLSALEGRVLGCLLEKEVTTPDIYPLTLNALVNACAQKNNRAPVMECPVRDVEAALESLRLKRLTVLFSGADSRVPKFRHTFDVVYPLPDLSRAIMTELLLRGPQTPAELRTRIERLGAMPSAVDVEAALVEMSENPSGALVIRLDRMPGQKERRWQQRIATETSGDSAAAATLLASASPSEPPAPSLESRVAALEATVDQLRSEISRLRQALGDAP